MGPDTTTVRIGSESGSTCVMMGGRIFGGRFFVAAETFSLTSWVAVSMSRSSLNVVVMLALPSLARTIISSIPETDEMASSRGSTTEETISSGLDPGRLTVTFTVAGSTLGNKSTPRERNEKTPNVTRNATSITAKTGRLTQISAIFKRRPRRRSARNSRVLFHGLPSSFLYRRPVVKNCARGGDRNLLSGAQSFQHFYTRALRCLILRADFNRALRQAPPVDYKDGVRAKFVLDGLLGEGHDLFFHFARQGPLHKEPRLEFALRIRNQGLHLESP